MKSSKVVVQNLFLHQFFSPDECFETITPTWFFLKSLVLFSSALAKNNWRSGRKYTESVLHQHSRQRLAKINERMKRQLRRQRQSHEFLKGRRLRSAKKKKLGSLWGSYKSSRSPLFPAKCQGENTCHFQTSVHVGKIRHRKNWLSETASSWSTRNIDCSGKRWPSVWTHVSRFWHRSAIQTP